MLTPPAFYAARTGRKSCSLYGASPAGASDRARLVEQLLSSLEEPDDQVATAWAIELERRSHDVAQGRVQTTDWDIARAEILKELDERRARRSTS